MGMAKTRTQNRTTLENSGVRVETRPNSHSVWAWSLQQQQQQQQRYIKETTSEKKKFTLD